MSNGHPGINACCTHPSRADVQVRPVSLGGNMVNLVHMVSLFVVQTKRFCPYFYIFTLYLHSVFILFYYNKNGREHDSQSGDRPFLL